MRISIFGVGYVGLVTGSCFAEMGNDVRCFDINSEKINLLKYGKIPIYEPGLEEIVLRNIKDGRLAFILDAKEAILSGDILFIAVGTPADEYGDADLTAVYKIAESIGEHLNKNNKIVVLKSTVPAGTGAEIEDIILKKLEKRGANFEFAVVLNPEFLKEGEAINDFMKPDRVVIGANKEWARKKMEELYAPLTKNGHPIFFMDRTSSEMSKYAANAMLALKISFINQMANLCEIVGADVEEVRKVICSDKRIGHYFLYPGVGYGGSCFPKDVRAIAALAKKFGYNAELIEAVESVNNKQKMLLAEKIIDELGNLKNKKIAVWGLSFKPKTDDMREAPSITIIEKLLAEGARVCVYDPVAEKEAKKIFNNRVRYASNMYECLKDAEALALITEWPQFKEPDFEKMKKLLKRPLIFDGRNIYFPARMKELGFIHIAIGRLGIKLNGTN